MFLLQKQQVQKYMKVVCRLSIGPEKKNTISGIRDMEFKFFWNGLTMLGSPGPFLLSHLAPPGL